MMFHEFVVHFKLLFCVYGACSTSCWDLRGRSVHMFYDLII